jgi:hypothetical protein
VTAADWIAVLGLVPHPEGGFYRETYRSPDTLAAAHLPPRYTGPRPCSTAIYFLLERGQVSALHRIKSDELWHFHAGGALVLSIIDPDGRLREPRLGPDPGRGEWLQIVVSAGCWFGAAVAGSDSYTLAGCTVAPGFDFADLELADRATLVARYPEHAALIGRLTR